MPKDTDLIPDLQAGEGPSGGQPAVYFVNADGGPTGGLDLKQLLAPIWRWRWAVCGMLLLTVLVGGWYFTRSPKLMHQFVIESGSYPRSLLLEQIEGVILPRVTSELPGGWMPVIDVGALVATDEPEPDDLATAKSLISISIPSAEDNSESQQILLDRLRAEMSLFSKNDAVIVDVAYAGRQAELKRMIAVSRRAYSIITEDSYVTALRGLVKKEMEFTNAAILRQETLFQFQSKRDASLDDRASRVSDRLDELLATMGGTGSAFSGAVQVLVDRITSLRLELEERIPAERLQIERRMGECVAEQDRLAAILSQQQLEAQNFDTDLLARQAGAFVAVARAERNLILLEAKKQAGLIFQSAKIIEEIAIARLDDNKRLKTLAILILGGMCSILSAYALEAGRLARLGTLET